MSSSPASSPVLTAHNLSKAYIQGRWPKRRIVALEQVNLALYPGRTLAVVGQSGSGKTTLAMCLAALEAPDSGEIWLNSVDLTAAGKRQLAEARAQLQLVFQDSAGALSPRLSAAEIVEEPLCLQRRLKTAERQELVAELLEQVGLTPDMKTRRPQQLSGGQRHRLAIARALAVRPSILILDEPFTGLDLSVRGQIIDLLLDVQSANGLSYLFISHELDVVRHFADEVAVIDQGRVVESGPVEQVLEQPVHTFTRVLLDATTVLAEPKHARVKEAACATS